MSFADTVGGRTDLRFTLDRAADYILHRPIFKSIGSNGLLNVADAVRYVDHNDLASINKQ